MKILRNKYFLLCVSAFLALIAVIIIVPNLDNSDNTINVIRLKENIASHTEITEDMLLIKKISDSEVPAGIIFSKEDIIGKYSRIEINKEDNLLSDKFITAEELENQFTYGFEEKDRAVSVTLKNNAAGLSGFLKAGDLVDAVIYKEDENTGKYDAENIPELMNLEVLAIFKNSQTDSEIIESVIFKVNADQALKLIKAENEGSIHLILSKRY